MASWVATEPIECVDPRLADHADGRPLACRRCFRRAPAPRPAPAALDVRSLTPLPGGATARLQLRRGEIVGLGGLEGQGQREIVRALAGVTAAATQATSCAATRGGDATRFDPRDGVVQIVRQGVGLMPEDRKLEGLYLELPIADNIGLGLLRGLRR